MSDANTPTAPMAVTATTPTIPGSDTDLTTLVPQLLTILHDVAPHPRNERSAVPQRSIFVTANPETTSLHVVWACPIKMDLSDVGAKVKERAESISGEEEIALIVLFTTFTFAWLAPTFVDYPFLRVPIRTEDEDHRRALGVPVPLWIIAAETNPTPGVTPPRLRTHAAVPLRLIELFGMPAAVPCVVAPSTEVLEEFVRGILPPPSREQGSLWHKVGCGLHHASPNNLPLFRTYTLRGTMGLKVLRKLAETWKTMMHIRASSKPVATWMTLRNMALMSSGDCTREAYIRWCERHNRAV